jgi:putative phosphoribosyl transferase
MLISRKSQLKFKDRQSAGKVLARQLRTSIDRKITLYDDTGKARKVIVLGIPKGGLITAQVVAEGLSVPLDIVVSRRLLDKNDKELTIGAITDGECHLNEKIIDALRISQEHIEVEKRKRLKEIELLNFRYHVNNKESLKDRIRDRITILIDDGASSGSTIVASIKYIRACGPVFIAVGIPVAPRATIRLIEKYADWVEPILTPSDKEFKSVEQYYVDFHPISDWEAEKAVTKSRYAMSFEP